MKFNAKFIGVQHAVELLVEESAVFALRNTALPDLPYLHLSFPPFYSFPD
jgi:hypothetical protein